MNPLVKILITLSICLWTAVLSFGQSLTGYASCDGAELNNYFVIIDVSGLTTSDIVTIGDVTMSPAEGSGQLVFGPYIHSGTGMAQQQVKLNGVDDVEVLETICGIYTGNGLHASGVGCANVDNISTGYVLAQSQPGTFHNDEEFSQTYVLADASNGYIASNMTGLFTDVANADYKVFGVNVKTEEAASFKAGLPNAVDVEDYFENSASCIAVCGAQMITVGCSTTPIYGQIDPDFEDPCDCRNRLNIFNDDGTVRYLHDVLKVTQANDADTWVFRNPTTDFYIQPSPGEFVLVTDGLELPGIGGGMFQIEVYHLPNVGWASDVMASAGPNAGFELNNLSNVCTNCDGIVIPTMGQWALFILALLLLNIGLIFTYNNREILATRIS